MSTSKGKWSIHPLEVEALLASVVANEEDREDEEDDAIGWAANPSKNAKNERCQIDVEWRNETTKYRY